jgi:hypothetical protein
MRQAIIDGISALSLGTFSVSSDLPWDAAGTPLYQKNFKVFYVDEPDSEESTLINVLNSSGSLATKTTTISVFVTVDAKQKPSNYDSLMNAVRDVKMTTEITAVRSRECDITRSFEADSLLTEFVFRFTEMKIN